MKKISQINKKINFNNKRYTIFGIDSYMLKNILDKKIIWTSYTLLDNQKNKTWVSGPFNGYYYQWFLLNKNEFSSLATDAHPFPDFSGIAQISFEGNQGFSTPYAEIFWVNLSGKEYDCLVIERFIKIIGDTIEILDSYYNAGKKLKNFTV